jgi:hypothetical protein
MNVVCKTQDIRLNHAWFEAERGYLHVEIDGVDRSIPFALIPDDDFESSAPIRSNSSFFIHHFTFLSASPIPHTRLPLALVFSAPNSLTV